MLCVLVARLLLVSCITRDTKHTKLIVHADRSVATLTSHHLYLTAEQWQSDPFAFCRPVAKMPSDRHALIKAACNGDPKFFLLVTTNKLYSYWLSHWCHFLFSGNDSAPHLIIAKQGGVDGRSKPPAGVFTQPFWTQYVLLALEEAIERGVIKEEDVTQTQERLEQFLGRFGRQFYKLPDTTEGNKIVLTRKGETIPKSIRSEDGSIEVALSRGGDSIFSLSWDIT